MVALRIEDVKGFTSRLFVKEDFDSFLLREAKLVTFAGFSMDGSLRKGYFTEDELGKIGNEQYAPWCLVRPFAFELIKGQRLPESFQIVLQLPARQIARFAAENGIEPEKIQGMYLNIRYEDRTLYVVTGFSLGYFTLDRTLESIWDQKAEDFLRKLGIACQRE